MKVLVVKIPNPVIRHFLFVGRQAWQSVGYLALNPEGLWKGFQEFYSELEREAELRRAAETAGELKYKSIARYWRDLSIPVSPLMTCRLVPSRVVSQYSQGLAEVIRLTESDSPPTTPELVHLRMS